MNINEVLKRATEVIPYYRNLQLKSNTNIESFPIISKEYYRNHNEEFFRNYSERDSMIKLRTSGSTGTPMLIYKSYRDYFSQLRCLWKLRYGLYGVKTTDKSVGFVASKNFDILYENKIMLIPIT